MHFFNAYYITLFSVQYIHATPSIAAQVNFAFLSGQVMKSHAISLPSTKYVIQLMWHLKWQSRLRLDGLDGLDGHGFGVEQFDGPAGQL